MPDAQSKISTLDDLLNTVEGDVQKHNIDIQQAYWWWKRALHNMLVLREHECKQAAE